MGFPLGAVYPPLINEWHGIHVPARRHVLFYETIFLSVSQERDLQNKGEGGRVVLWQELVETGRADESDLHMGYIKLGAHQSHRRVPPMSFPLYGSHNYHYAHSMAILMPPKSCLLRA